MLSFEENTEEFIRSRLLDDIHNNNSSFVSNTSSYHQEARFLARDPSEAVYRTVERARLALSQTVVKL